jgi:hypothetical protein
MQVTKFFCTVKTSLGEDLTFDLMQIEAYKGTDKDETGAPGTGNLVWIRLSSGDVYVIKGTMARMEKAMSTAGVPFYPFT